jgi:hypothetical protein
MRAPHANQRQASEPPEQIVIKHANLMIFRYLRDNLELATAHKIDVSFIGKELKRQLLVSLPGPQLREPMHRKQLRMEFQREPEIRGRKKKPFRATLAYSPAKQPCPGSA